MASICHFPPCDDGLSSTEQQRSLRLRLKSHLTQKSQLKGKKKLTSLYFKHKSDQDHLHYYYYQYYCFLLSAIEL